jgi:serine/threonine-protein kinase
MLTEEAIKVLEKKGFKYTVESKEDDTIEEGYVIKTSPKAGSNKKKGSTITIIESSGLSSYVLEDYTGKNYNAIEEKLKNMEINVKIEKKSVDNSSDYIGNEDIIIDQKPAFDKENETILEKGDTVTLYIPDIVSTYPDMVEEGWSLSDAETFAEKYQITLKVKDKNGKSIQDYSEYLSESIINQSRPAGDNIISGITLTLTIDIDSKTYTVTANYYLKDTTSAIEDSQVIADNLKNGEKGSYTCKGISGYTAVSTSATEYTINEKNISINCYYTKNEDTTE